MLDLPGHRSHDRQALHVLPWRRTRDPWAVLISVPVALIGVAAFFIAAWWTMRKDPSQQEATGGKGLSVIWERFPKFVLGFIAVSLVFSFLIPADTSKQVSGFLNGLRTIWFALAFVAIGLEARFADLVKLQGGRPALAFIGAQVFNILWTLFWAWLLFGGILLPAPDIQ